MHPSSASVPPRACSAPPARPSPRRHIPRWASAAGARDPRLVVIILRGALDGLSAVAPIGDPDYADLHGELALALGRRRIRRCRSTASSALNPAMTNFARLYDAKQALIVHAAATNYRERSHFDGQDVLESGMPAPGPRRERLAQSRGRGAAERASASPSRRALAVGAIAAAGDARPGADSRLGAVGPRRADRRSRRAADGPLRRIRSRARQGAAGGPRRRPAWRRSQGMDGAQARRRRRGGDAQGGRRRRAADGAPTTARASRALAFDGWDTHANEGGATGRLAQLLGGLDGAFAAFESELGPRWKDTVVVAITEFGRTAHINGTVGTDHGTGDGRVSRRRRAGRRPGRSPTGRA